MAKVEVVDEKEGSSELIELQDLLEQNNKIEDQQEELVVKPDIIQDTKEIDQNYKPDIQNFKSPLPSRAPSNIYQCLN